MSAGTDYAIAELQHAVRELAARVDSIEHSTCQGQCGLDVKKLTALPVGSVVEDRRGRRWKRADDGKWYRLVLGVVAAEGGAYSHELHTVRGPLTEVDDDDTDEADYLSVDDLLTARFDVPVRDRHGDRWEKTDGHVDGYAAWRLTTGTTVVMAGSHRLLYWLNPEPDVERGAPDRKLRVWTFEALESLPIGWTVRDRDGDPWEKAGYRGDGTSMWRPGDSDSLPRSSEALMRWMNPVNVAGMTVKELAAAADGTRVVDALNDTWRKEGDKFVHVQWPSAAPVAPETLRQYGPILEATV